MISYTDRQTNLTWRANFFAAKLVTPGYSGLPPQIGEFTFTRLNPERFGLPGVHPLQRIYPNVEVLHYGLVVPERYRVTAGGKTGVAFWINNNGSGPSASVTSEMGRSNVAPLQWTGDDAVARPYWEWRQLIVKGQPMLWTNARGHGFNGLDGRDDGYDWLDGTPTDLETMYERGKGKTAQSVVVPKYYEIGTARQTLPEDSLVGTYSIMLYFPRSNQVEQAKKLANFSSLMTWDQAYQRFQDYGSRRRTLGVDRGGFESFSPQAKSLGLESDRGGLEPEFEITHGHEMTQHIIAPPMVNGLWQDAPSAVLVCWPISEEQAAVIDRPDVPEGRKGFGW